MKRSDVLSSTSKHLFEHGYVRNLCDKRGSTWYFNSEGSRVRLSYSKGLQEVTWEHYGEDFLKPTNIGVGARALASFLHEGAPKEKIYRIEHMQSKGKLSQYRVYAPNSKYPVLLGHDEASDTWKGYNYGRDSNNLLGDDQFVSIVKRWRKLGNSTGTSDKVLTTVDRQYSGYEGPRFHNSHMPVGIPDKRPPFR